MIRAAALGLAIAATAACSAIPPRFPDDVAAALARDPMRRLETDQLVLYYPAARRALAERVAARLEYCAGELRRRARIDNRLSREKLIVVVPDAPYNNAYVLPPVGGLEDVAVVPAGDTLDFVTEFGLPPDAGMTGCHELTHYVQLKQIAGLWGVIDTVFGSIATPQGGFEPWFLEGLATYYEARLQPGVGRPRWPVFVSMFHAAYPGAVGLDDDALSESQRGSVAGNHYLVGTMFVSWLADTYGEPALWRLIAEQAHSVSIIFDVDGTFEEVYGKGLHALLDEFRRSVRARFPRRARPAGEAVVQRVGTDARWAWAADGSTAIVDEDLDRPTRLVVRDRAGRERDAIALASVVPPRPLAVAGAILVTGLSFTADGRDLYFTALDQGATYQTTRLLRLRVGTGALIEVARDLGSGGAISPDGSTYYALASDGDRWSVIARELRAGVTRSVWQAAPGQFALRVGVAPDGRTLAVSLWDGARYAIRVIDAHGGATVSELAGASGGPVYDAGFAPDGRLVFLDEVDGRFQAFVREPDGTRTRLTDAPYGALEVRAVGDRLRFLARDGWRQTLDEVALPAARSASAPAAATTTAPTAPAPAIAPARVVSDAPYSRLDGLLVPTLRVPAVLAAPPTFAAGLTLGGGDRLGYLQWTGTALIDVDDGRVSGGLELVEHELAPWTIAASATRLAYHDEVLLDDDTTQRRDRETRGGGIGLGRIWRGSWSAWAAGTYLHDRTDARVQRLFGPSLDLGYRAVEATPYTGVRRGLALSLHAAYYPRRVPDDLVDVGGAVHVHAPLPITRRDLVDLRLRGRALLGDDDGLLALGGIDPAAVLWSRPGLALDDARPLPAGAAFDEALRGFEDVLVLGQRAGLAELGWRHPFIIDRGVGLGFLPPGFLSQIDLELFGSLAWLDPGADPWHAAAGGALVGHLTFVRLPLAVRYQLSRRLTDDRGWLQLATLAVDL